MPSTEFALLEGCGSAVNILLPRGEEAVLHAQVKLS
jgi:hypothetical protein